MTRIQKSHTVIPITIHAQASTLIGNIEERLLPPAAKQIVARYGFKPHLFSITPVRGRLRLSFPLLNEEYRLTYKLWAHTDLSGIHLKSKVFISRSHGETNSKSHNLSKWLGKDPANLTAEDLVRDFEWLFAKIVEPLPPLLKKSFLEKTKGQAR